MNRVLIVLVGVTLLALLTGGNCSRERVESLQHMNNGVNAFMERRYQVATEELQRATVVDPTNDEAFYSLAQVHMELDRFEQAEESIEQAISINGEVAAYHEKLGTIRQFRDDYSGASEAFERAIALDSNLFKAYFKLGQVLEAQAQDAGQTQENVRGFNQQALQRYSEAIEHGPRFMEAYIALGRLYYDLRFYDQAASVLGSGLEVALDGTEEQANLHHILGTVHAQQGQTEDAIGEFQAALEITPSHADALFSIGWAYSLTGDRDEARRYLKKYISVAGREGPSAYIQAARDRMGDLASP